MAKVVLTNPQVSIGGVDLSGWVTNVTLQTTYDIIETTTFGSTAKSRVAGLADNSCSFDFIQDFANSAVEQTIYPLLGTAAAVIVKPVNTTTTTTNPQYSFNALVSDWTPLKGAVGQLSTATITWPISGAITKANS